MLGQRGFDQKNFCHPQGHRSGLKPFVRGQKGRIDRIWCRGGDGAWQIGHCDMPGLGQGMQVDDRIPQFADVTWPGMGEHGGLNLGTENQHVTASFLCKFAVLVFGDEQDVLTPVLQGRDRKHSAAEPVEQVAPELPRLDLGLQIPVGQ